MGKIELDHTGSGSGITLSSDGTDLLLDGTAIGGGGGSTITVDSKTAGYTIVSGDAGKLISFSGGSLTASLTAAATLGNGFYVYIENNAANGQNTYVVTIDPNASETIDGRSSILLRQGQRILIVCDGSEWKTVADFNRAIATNATADFFNLPQATGDESVAIGLGAIASNTNTTAIGTNAEATGSYATSFGTGPEATAFASLAAGYNSVSSGSQSIALGVSRASGDDSLAAAITNNTSSYGATGANSIAIGYRAKATDSRAVVIGGSTNTAAGPDSIVLGGQKNTAGTFSDGSAIASGYDSHAYGEYSIALGNRGRALQLHKYAHGVYPVGSQYGRLILKAETTDATATAFKSGGIAVSNDNQLILPDNSAFAFHGTIVARQQASAGTASAAWKVEGLIRREGSAGTTVLVNSATTVLDNTPSWGLTLSADTTNGGLKIEATGAASTNIRWVATIHTSEVTYA